MCARPTLGSLAPLDLSSFPPSPYGRCYVELSFHHLLSDGRVLQLQVHTHQADWLVPRLPTPAPQAIRC